MSPCATYQLTSFSHRNLRKVNILLNALCRQGKKIDYYALDLDLSELRRTLDMLPAEPLGDVRYNGLHGTYEDGHAWLNSSPEVGDRPRCVLWLGSSLGNFKTLDAVQFLKSFIMDGLRAGSRDCMLVAIDGCKDAGRVYSAYNDQQGITESFIMSGLTNANKILEGEYFDLDKWGYRGEWNAELGRHQAYYVPTQDIRFPGKLDGVLVKKGELVNIEYSYKFDVSDSRHLWEEAGLVESAQWVNKNGDYCSYIQFIAPSFLR